MAIEAKASWQRFESCHQTPNKSAFVHLCITANSLLLWNEQIKQLDFRNNKWPGKVEYHAGIITGIAKSSFPRFLWWKSLTFHALVSVKQKSFSAFVMLIENAKSCTYFLCSYFIRISGVILHQLGRFCLCVSKIKWHLSFLPFLDAHIFKIRTNIMWKFSSKKARYESTCNIW